jgi:diguanylate cyclase (GGDEF)-like protein
MRLKRRLLKSYLAMTLISTIGLAYVYGYFAHERLLSLTERTNIQLTQLLATSHSGLIERLVSASNHAPISPQSEAYQALNQALIKQVANLTLLEMKVMDLNGVTRFASDHSKLNRPHATSIGFQSALQGEPFSKLEHKQQVTGFNGIVQNADIMSTYLPIYGAAGKLHYVVEVYNNVSEVTHDIASNQQLILAVAIVIFFFLATLIVVDYKLESAKPVHAGRRKEFHDPTTGLPSIALFNDRLDQAIKRAKRRQNMLAVMAIAIPRMKKLYNNLSETDANNLSLRISNRLLNALRDSDTLSRQDNGDYLVILDNLDSIEAAQKVAQRMIQSMIRAFKLAERDIFLLPNIGIAVFPMDGMVHDTLIKGAYTALHKARETGKAQFRFYTTEMSDQIDRQIEMESRLLTALDNDQFVLHYQPLMDVLNKKEFGVEALIRWQHPTMGMVSPADFIPLLEETGLIVPVGNWVLNTACTKVAQLQKIAPDLTVHVNLSAKQFHQADLIDVVREALNESGLKPESLDLEITESVVIEDIDNVIDKLRQLNKLGVTCSIDDFGTGYSSLSYLKRLPIQTLKIDRSFIKDLHIDGDDCAIVEAISALSGSLRLRVIAEGVETENQLEFLNGIGIRYVQGFLYSKPLPEDELEAFIRKGQDNLQQLSVH